MKNSLLRVKNSTAVWPFVRRERGASRNSRVGAGASTVSLAHRIPPRRARGFDVIAIRLVEYSKARDRYGSRATLPHGGEPQSIRVALSVRGTARRASSLARIVPRARSARELTPLMNSCARCPAKWTENLLATRDAVCGVNFRSRFARASPAREEADYRRPRQMVKDIVPRASRLAVRGHARHKARSSRKSSRKSAAAVECGLGKDVAKRRRLGDY